MDAIVKGVSCDDPTPQKSEDEPVKEVAIGGGRETSKRRRAWVDSPLAKDVGTSTIGKHLLKILNMDFLLRSLMF